MKLGWQTDVIYMAFFRHKKSPDWRSFLIASKKYWSLSWCPRPDLNRHGFRHYPLKIACLPIPPLGHFKLIKLSISIS